MKSLLETLQYQNLKIQQQQQQQQSLFVLILASIQKSYKIERNTIRDELQYNTVRDELEGEITLKECQDMLGTFKREKSPGDDGFMWEFYNCFFDLLGRDLVDSFNSAYNASEMSISQRRGVITLVPKEDADLESLKAPNNIIKFRL